MDRRKDARGKGLASLQLTGQAGPQGLCIPGSDVQGGPQPQSPSLTKALGGVEPKSHHLPVSRARHKSLVTRTGNPPQLRGCEAATMGPRSPGHPDPCPSLPTTQAWTHARGRHRPPLRTFPRCWVGVPSCPPPACSSGRFRSLPLHAKTSAKAST